MSNLHNIIEIKKIIDEAKDFKSFFFDYKLYLKPGQFIMLWIPGIDEKPFTVSYHDKEQFGITVQKKGRFTEKLFGLKHGSKLGFRGPYGNGYNIIKKNACVVGGGCGIAAIAPLI